LLLAFIFARMQDKAVEDGGIPNAEEADCFDEDDVECEAED
jgi:hypothetical protein